MLAPVRAPGVRKRESVVADERYLVTGGTGCIGSWVVAKLVREVVSGHGPDIARRLDRLRLMLSTPSSTRSPSSRRCHRHRPARGSARRRRQPGCPPRCHAVPVLRRRPGRRGAGQRRGHGHHVRARPPPRDRPPRLCQQRGRLWAEDSLPDDVVGPDAALLPTSRYGVFKVANEKGARVSWANHGVASVGLRPHSAYGPGRDQA